MDKYAVNIIPPNFVHLIWDKVKPIIAKLEELVPHDIVPEVIKSKLISGSQLLLAVSEGDDIIAVITMDITVLDDGHRVLYIPVVSGHSLSEWLNQAFELCSEVAKAHNCKEIRGSAIRPGWVKVFGEHGHKPLCTVMSFNTGD